MKQLATIDEQIACVKRELSFRRRVYERRVESGKMSQNEADKEINRMQAVYYTLVEVRDRDQGQLL